MDLTEGPSAKKAGPCREAEGLTAQEPCPSLLAYSSGSPVPDPFPIAVSALREDRTFEVAEAHWERTAWFRALLEVLMNLLLSILATPIAARLPAACA